jgi:ubiquinone/menaquinone biosynthesis C-methylase UbiE
MNSPSEPANGVPAREDKSRFNFGPLARTYDEWYATPAGRAYDAAEKRAVSELLPQAESGARLLDVGCGTGHWSAFFAEQGYAVTGVDIAPEMLAAARAKGISNARFRLADAHELPFENGRFDVAAAITAIEFARDAVVVVREMARCTVTPGGAILVGILNALAGINIERQEADILPYADARFFSPEEVEELLGPYGRVRILVRAFAPLAERVGRQLGSRHGAFIVGIARR